MGIITIEGEALRALLNELAHDLIAGRDVPYRLRVANDGGEIKFKIDEGMWSPPFPEAAEDVRRRARSLPRGMQIGDYGTQTNYFG